MNFDIRLDNDELKKPLWMPVDEYLAREATSPFNRRVVQAALATSPLPDETLDAYMDEPDSYEVFMADASGSASTPRKDR